MSAVTMKIDEILASGAQLNSAFITFLKVDLDIALTFSALALGTRDAIKRERYRRRVLSAYRTVDRLSGRVTLTANDAQLVAHKLEQLRLELLQLEEAG